LEKTVAIIQSNYIPWKGYFDIIAMADEFILLDDVQYTRQDWRNRNRIKTASGTLWLSIPTKRIFQQNINEVEVSQPNWTKKHWRTISQSYSKAPYFEQFQAVFASLYANMSETRLSQINYAFITAICGILGIETKISWSTDYAHGGGEKTSRLIELCTQANATGYLSGPSAKDYIETDLFDAANIQLDYMDYAGYPEYHQLHGPFEHAVSVLDLIFNEGPNAANFMKAL